MSKLETLRKAWEAVPDGIEVPKGFSAWLQPLINAVTAIVKPERTDWADAKPDPAPLPDLPAGVYKHYKGHLYQVLGYGHDANDTDRRVVVYIGLHTLIGHVGPRLSCRTAVSDDPDEDTFFDWVHLDDGSKCHEKVECCSRMSGGMTLNELTKHDLKERARRFTYMGTGTTEGMVLHR